MKFRTTLSLSIAALFAPCFGDEMKNSSMIEEVRILLVPGGGGLGPDHWQTYWKASDTGIEQVVQSDWNGGTREEWVAALDAHINSSDRPVVLVGHSLGNIVVAHWASSHSGPVVGALLVAPADVDDDWAEPDSLYKRFSPIPMNPLLFPTTMVASNDDPYLSIARARSLGAAWGSELIETENTGHIGSASKLKDWPVGRELLDELIARILRPPSREVLREN